MHPDTDHLAMVGHQHQLVFLDHREARHHFAIAVACLDIGNALAATSGLAVIGDRCALAITVLGDRQHEFPLGIRDDRHRHHLVIAKQPDPAHPGAVPSAEDPHSLDRKTDGFATPRGQQQIIALVTGRDADKLITFGKLHGDLAVALDIGEIAEPVAPNVAGRCGEHDVKVVPAVLVIGHRHDGIDGFAGFDGKQVHHRLAKSLRCRLGKLVAFQLIDHARRGEEQNRRMGIGDKQTGDEILVPRLHARTPLTAAPLRPVDRQRHPLDIAAVADGDDHVFLLDQVFIILIDKLIRDFRAAVIGQPFAGSGQFLQHHIIHA